VLTEHLEKFNEILKFRPDLESLQSGNELLEASKASKQNLGKIKDELLQCDRSLESADVELAKINSMIVELTKGCRNRMEQFQGEAISGGASKEVIEGSAVDEHLKQLLMGLNEDKENFNQQSVANRSLKTLVETFEKFASEHRKCPICAKQVESDKQLEKIRSKCASLQADITPEVLKTLERNVQGIERKIQALSTAIQLRQELKDLEAQLAEKSREKEHILATKAEFVNAQVSWKERQQEAAEYDEKVNHLSLIVDEMDLKTLAKAKSELSSSKFSDDVKESCENRSYENLLNSRKELEDECLELESKIEALYKQRDSSKVKEETLQKEISSFNEIQLRISKLEKQVVDTEKELRNAEREMESDEKLLVKKEEEKSSLNDKIAKLQQSNDTVLHAMKEKLFQVKTYDSEIFRTSKRSLKDEMIELEAKIAREEKIQEQYDEKIKDISLSKATMEPNRDQQDLIRSMENFLKFKKYERDCEECQQEISAIQKQFPNVKTFQDLKRRQRELEQEIEQIKETMNQIRGSAKHYAEGISNCRSELSKSDYHDIDKNYTMELVKLNAKKIAEQDLEKCYKALDRALVKFHTLKMEQINQCLKEYWQNTYQGDDIAYIEIKTDIDDSNNRRSHNYRLVMKCLDAVELDMRGRCSAGQKVLASLVVRLALAETFCHNCGILALDEPTANLDSKNIVGFTEALSRLVNERKAESDTFQLIVISHDKEFIESLAFKTGTSHYMRVERETSRYSRIVQHDWNNHQE